MNIKIKKKKQDPFIVRESTPVSEPMKNFLDRLKNEMGWDVNGMARDFFENLIKQSGIRDKESA